MKAAQAAGYIAASAEVALLACTASWQPPKLPFEGEGPEGVQ